MQIIRQSFPPLGIAGYDTTSPNYAGPQAVSTTAAAIFQIDTHHAPAFLGLTFFVGSASSLASFSIAAATRATAGTFTGTYIPWLSGTAFGTPSTLNPLTISSAGAWAIPIPASTNFMLVLDTRAFDSIQISASGTAATTLDVQANYWSVLPVNQ